MSRIRFAAVLLRLTILAAFLGLAYAVYCWRRNGARAIEAVERKRRHREQQEAWDRMLAGAASERCAGVGDSPDPIGA